MLAVRPACELRFGKEKSAERLCFLRVEALDHTVRCPQRSDAALMQGAIKA